MQSLRVSALVLSLALPSLVGAQPTLIQIKHDGPVLSVAWSFDGKSLASGTEGGRVVISEMPSAREIAVLHPEGGVSGIAFSSDGKWLGVKSGFQSGPLSVWDIAQKKKLRQLAYKDYSCDKVAFSTDGEHFLASGAGEHMVWNHTKGGGYGSRSGKVAEGSSAAISANGSVLAWAQPQGALQIFQPEARKYQRVQIGPTVALALTPDGRFLAAANPDRTIRLWAVGGAEVRKFEGLREPAKLLHFSGNGKVLAAACADDPVVRLWDANSGRLRRRLTSPATVRALALSPDGFSLALATGNVVQVWNVATRELGDLGKPKMLSPAELKAAWEDLAASDPAKAENAFRELAAAQEHGIGFLKSQVRAVAVPPVDWDRVGQLLKDLDDAAYPVRQRASLELARLGEVIQPALVKYLAAKPSLEAERRARKLLERLQDTELSPDRLRCLEAIEILEILHTAGARAVLEEVARDSLLAQIRLAAGEALGRWQR